MRFGLIAITTSIIYLLLMFFIAWRVDKLAARGQSPLRHSAIFALTLAVYCTAWTYYGSVGLASKTGPAFLAIYLGPLLFSPLMPLVLRKIVVISKHQRINSIADFIAARYGKNASLGIIVCIIALLGIIPYISIQLKAIASSFELLISSSPILSNFFDKGVFYRDLAFFIAVILGIFTLFFGTRHIDPNERQEGLVGTIAFESIFKLIAFFAAGLWVTFGLFDGFGDIFEQINANEAYRHILTLDVSGTNSWSWMNMILLSMSAIFLLPRQFHMSIVESTDERFVYNAAWLLPLYLLLINIFVLPIAGAGLLVFGENNIDPDTFLINLPMAFGHNWIALLVFLGGLSAATSMVIVSVIALSIMVINNLIVPMIIRTPTMVIDYSNDVGTRLLHIRRLSIMVILFLAYGYFSVVADQYSIVSIGLVSFAAVFQFAPPVLFGLYWKSANQKGAMAGLISGFLIWVFTLPFPTLIDAGVFDASILSDGFLGINALRPRALFGLDCLDPVSHATFWSISVNVFCLFFVSIFSQQSTKEIVQADLFVNIHKYTTDKWDSPSLSNREAQITDLEVLMIRFLGKEKGTSLLKNYALSKNLPYTKMKLAKSDMVQFVETQLAGVLGSSSAHVLVNSVSTEDPISLQELFAVLEQTQETIEMNHKLQAQSNQLQNLTKELTKANTQLLELDNLKADFINTITHELRTPITAIRSISGILRDKPEASAPRKQEFLDIIVRECERISRLVNDVLDLQKLDANQMVLRLEKINFLQEVQHCAAIFEQNAASKNIAVHLEIPDNPIYITGDSDRLIQAIENLLSNAIKFCPETNGNIWLKVEKREKLLFLSIKDNGQGIPTDKQNAIFDPFVQVKNAKGAKSTGTGLGLAITKKLIEQHGGKIFVHSVFGEGTEFVISIPIPSF